MLEGSCGCGQVRYQIRGELLGPITYCHCRRCRKHSGSSFGTTVGVRAEELAFVAGEAALGAWESSPGVRRHFATCCGSPIYKTDEANPQYCGLRMGTLDTDPGRSADMHFSTASKVPWLEICDDLEQVEGDEGPFPL